MTNWNSWLCFVHFFTQTSSSWCHKAHNVTKLVDFLVGIDGASTLHLLNSLRPKDIEIEAFSNDTSISVKTNVIIVKSDVKSPIISIFSQLQVNYSKKVVTKTLTFYWKRGIAESQSNFLFFWYQNIQNLKNYYSFSEKPWFWSNFTLDDIICKIFIWKKLQNTNLSLLMFTKVC